MWISYFVSFNKFTTPTFQRKDRKEVEIEDFYFNEWYHTFMWSKSLVASSAGVPHSKSRPCKVFAALGLLETELWYFLFVTWPHMTTWSEDHITWWVGVPPLNDHSAKFDGHKICESEDVTFSICNMISHVQVIKGSRKFMDGSFSL